MPGPAHRRFRRQDGDASPVVPHRKDADDRCVARLMILWRRPHHLTSEEAGAWASRSAERLLAADAIASAELTPLRSVSGSHPREWDWLLELRLSPGADVQELVAEAACADWLGDLQQLGMKPTVMLVDGGTILRPDGR
jgi:hypothetical protein